MGRVSFSGVDGVSRLFDSRSGASTLEKRLIFGGKYLDSSLETGGMGGGNSGRVGSPFHGLGSLVGPRTMEISLF